MIHPDVIVMLTYIDLYIFVSRIAVAAASYLSVVRVPEERAHSSFYLQFQSLQINIPQPLTCYLRILNDIETIKVLPKVVIANSISNWMIHDSILSTPESS